MFVFMKVNKMKENWNKRVLPLLHSCWKNTKQWPLAGEFVEFEYSPKIRQFGEFEYSPKWPFWRVWPGLDTFARHSPTLLPGLDTFDRHSPTTFPGLDTFDRHSPTLFPGLDTFAGLGECVECIEFIESSEFCIIWRT
jgi:hypothetical protein